MGLLDLFTRTRQRPASPSIEAIAIAIGGNLRALGLHVRTERYGKFVELRASTSPKMITLPGSNEASGVALLLASTYDPPQLVFEQINSLGGGFGARMVAATLAGLQASPGAIDVVRVNDLSPFMKDGRRWWERIAGDYPQVAWRITHDEDTTHIGSGSARVEQGAPALLRHPDFLSKQAKLRALAERFGYDPAKITLQPPKPAFDYLGQRFVSEAESFPDGRVAIYYDATMSDARMGCCLAHELQHVRYDVVRSAFLSEPINGPLHLRFEKYTPALLAAQRGVSNYSNEHWDAWKGSAPPELFSHELEAGRSEPISETIAEVAKAIFNWGDKVRINPVWLELQTAINEEYDRLSKLTS